MKKSCKLFLTTFIVMAMSSSLIPLQAKAISMSNDKSVLKISTSNEPGGINYTDEAGILSGPKSFAVYLNNYYILDGSKKLIYVCKNNQIVKRIDLSFTQYPTDIRINKDNMYILDSGDKDTLFILDKEGNIKNKKDLSKTLTSTALFLDVDNNSLVVTDINGNKTTLNEQFSIDKETTNNIKVKLSSTKNAKVMLNSQKEISVNVNELLGSLSVNHIDKNNNAFVSIEEIADTDKVIVEQTLRKYDDNGDFISTARVPLEKYYAYPNRFVDINDAGKAYCLVLEKNAIEILELGFVSKLDSQLGKEKEAYLKTKALTNSPSSTASVQTILSNNDGNITRSTAKSEASYLINLAWTLHNNNRKAMSGVTIPTQLRSISNGSTAYGIPYCWGGFDSDHSSSSSSWSNYGDAMAMGMNAGNTNCSGYYKGGTAGLDCSGYVSAALYLSNKWGTNDFLNNTSYFQTITTSGLSSMDIMVSSGHIVFFNSRTSTGMNTFECTTSGTGESCKNYFRSWSSVSNYTPRSCFR